MSTDNLTSDTHEIIQDDDDVEIDENELIQIIKGNTSDFSSGRVKHERVNRRQERRRKKKGYQTNDEKSKGYYVEYNPSSGVQKLPTSVRVMRKDNEPIVYVKK